MHTKNIDQALQMHINHQTKDVYQIFLINTFSTKLVNLERFICNDGENVGIRNSEIESIKLQLIIQYGNEI